MNKTGTNRPESKRRSKDANTSAESVSKESETTSESNTRKLTAGHYLLYVGMTLAGCFVDLLTKHLVFAKYHIANPTEKPTQHWWIDGWLGIETSLNQGALFGMGSGNSRWFALLSVAALIGIIFWLFVRNAATDRWLSVALGSISGGILGNLYDRLGLWHGGSARKWQGENIPDTSIYGVRDWIHFRWEGAPLKILDPWPNFNIADSLLLCGAFALFLHALFGTPVEQREPESSDDS